MSATAILLAAGLGTRMKSALPKALHPIAGRPMLAHLIESCAAAFEQIVVVVGPDMEALAKVAAPHPVVVQHERLGTAHAALQAADLFGDGDVAVLYADNPLITARHPAPPAPAPRRRRRGAGPAGHAPGRPRPLRPRHRSQRLRRPHRRMGRRHPRGTRPGPVQRRRAVRRRHPHARLAASRPQRQRQGRILPHRRGGPRPRRTARWWPPSRRREAELRGINSRTELAEAEASVQARLRHAAMAAGVTMTDPASVFLCTDTRFGTDVTLGPNVVFGPGVTIGSGVDIRAFSHLEGCHVGTRRHRRPLRPAAARYRAGRARPRRQFRRTEGGAAGRGRQGQPPQLPGRRRHRRRQQYRRRHHHLQLRRVRQTPHHDRRQRVHGLGRRPGGAGDDRRRRIRHRGQRDHRERGAGRDGVRPGTAKQQAGLGRRSGRRAKSK